MFGNADVVIDCAPAGLRHQRWFTYVYSRELSHRLVKKQALALL